MEETFEEFRKRASGRGHSKGKVAGSFGVYSAYKAIRKHHWYNIGRPLKEAEFYAIIRGINRLLAEEIAKGETVKLPERMGKLELRKYKRGVFMVGDKLKVTYSPDWSETLKLWYEDAEARANKTLLRHETPYVYHVKYLTIGQNANYENKGFYQFALNTFIRRALSKNIKESKVDTLW